MKSEELALLDRLVDDRLLPGDRELINEMLVEKAEFRRLFVTYLDLHNSLAWIERATEAAGDEGPALNDGHRRSSGLWSWWPLLVAAGLVLAATVVHRLGVGPVAPGAGEKLAISGSLSLPSGKSSLQLPNGTKLEVVGPAELVIAPDQSVELVRGRLGVELPPGVSEFRLRTPVVEIVDLGTAFLAAANAEQTVVAVRQGAVRVTHAGEAVDMVAGTSAVFRRGEGVSRFPLDLEDQDYMEQAFVTGVTLDTGLDAAPVRLSGAARWVDPDQIPASKDVRDDDMLVTLVRRNWTMPAAAPALVTEPGFVDQFEAPEAIVATGARVDVYRIYYAPTRTDRGVAALEFPTPVVGIVATTENLRGLDALMGMGVAPKARLGRGLESRTGKERNHDVVNLHRNRRLATIAMAVGEQHADEVVILVASPTGQ